jgi:hypothetical protein
MDMAMAASGAIAENLLFLADAASKMAMALLEGLIQALYGITEGALQLVLAGKAVSAGIFRFQVGIARQNAPEPFLEAAGA